MLIKTPEFLNSFLEDLKDIVYFKNVYIEQLSRLKTESKKTSNPDVYIKDNMKMMLATINFVGSFCLKDYGSIISDIDLIQNTPKKATPDIILERIKQIISSKKFTFIRFFCGQKKGMSFPWTIKLDGCIFDLSKMELWMANIKKNIPKNVYEKVEEILIDSDALSISDLINVEKIVETYISLSWTKDEIMKGEKIDNGIVYNFIEVYEKEQTSKKIIKMLYTYDNPKDSKNKKEYCLIDLSLNKQKNSEVMNLYSYYSKNMMKKFKELRFFLPEELKNTFSSDLKNTLKHLTSISTRIDLINRISKYKSVSSDEILRLKHDLIAFGNKYKYEIKLDSDLIQEEKQIHELISLKVSDLYSKYINLVKPENKNMLIYYRARELETDVKIPKTKLSLKSSYCPFLTLDRSQIDTFIGISEDICIEPLKLINCVNRLKGKYEVQNIMESFDDTFIDVLKKSCRKI